MSNSNNIVGLFEWDADREKFSIHVVYTSKDSGVEFKRVSSWTHYTEMAMVEIYGRRFIGVSDYWSGTLPTECVLEVSPVSTVDFSTEDKIPDLEERVAELERVEDCVLNTLNEIHEWRQGKGFVEQVKCIVHRFIMRHVESNRHQAR